MFETIYYIQTAIHTVFIALLLYTVICMFRSSKYRDTRVNTTYYSKFLIMIPAHNESAVIESTIRNIRKNNYDTDKYDIVVIADNCSDNTADIARYNKVRVLQRKDKDKKGKFYALRDGYTFMKELDDYDAICILDADNFTSPKFLDAMNYSIINGRDIIQSNICSKNPGSSWVSFNYSIAYSVFNLLFQKLRHENNISVALLGTGMVFKREVFETLMNTSSSAYKTTEDLAMYVDIVLSDRVVYWESNATVYDESPIDLYASVKQRKRWMEGNFELNKKHTFKLLKKALRCDISAIDCLVRIYQPFIFLLGGASFILDSTMFFMFDQIVPPTILLVLILQSLMLVYIDESILYDLSKGTIVRFISLIFFPLTWVYVIILALLGYEKGKWHHTKHTVTEMKE